jgi:predicted RNA binding protein YcfA (HicA-like mRNA interferase family)
MKGTRHPDGRTAAARDHRGEDPGRGTLAKILRDAGSSPEEFVTWLAR